MFFKIFLYFALIIYCSAYKCQVTDPVWSKTYTVQGTILIPYAELVEPFCAWYDGVSKASRIDYYGGMVKTYQLAKENDYGVSIKIAPITTEEQLNSITCLQVNGTGENPITPQNVLPDLRGFTCVGEEIIDGIKTEKLQFKQEFGNKINKYTMWLRYKKNSDGGFTPIPVRYEMKGFNSLLGSHYDHYYLNYDYFDNSDIASEVFEVANNMTCVGFPGPGDKHIYTFNPMREFMLPHYEGHVDFEFDKFKSKHNRQYETKLEHEKRKEIFRQNLRFIHSKNRAQLGYSLGVNHLADHTELELKALRGKQYTSGYNGGNPFPYSELDIKKALVTILPDQLDWRLFGAVTPVKDQSICGSCWSFGTVGAIEGAYFLKNGGNLVRLSQQALIDCSWGYGNNGCDGGEDFRAYQWMLKHGGIPTEEEYGPYLGQDGYCHANNVSLVAKITGFVNVTTNNQDALRLAIAKHGPISVAIDASHKTFSFYSNGLYYEPKCKNGPDELDHAVLAVGYGVMNGQLYWLVKNSWSTYWGNDGYILMSAKNNNCGVMTDPTYVTM
ncbi:digestive cysteine proteinase 1 [Chrysoperla carnea]|uniref:digestive cysteine proteinase 1 n=1 Tax=Chrysoperla carnea TaxID=189513 RepID=UPI001D078FE3|nr:digestive cysteine proteinase 1 [Chrysoperla carnea]